MRAWQWLLFTLAISAAQSTGAQQSETHQPQASAGATESARPATIDVYKYTNKQGVTSFSDRRPMNQPYRVVRLNPDCYACDLDSTVDWYSTPLYLTSFKGYIGKAARQHGVDPALIRAVIHAESAFKPDAKSRVGALGLMQLMPATAKDMGVADPMSPQENIQGGVRYLAWLMRKTQGDITLATAAYNAGPGAVERYRGIPPYEETETYVRRVRILHDRYRRALNRSS